MLLSASLNVPSSNRTNHLETKQNTRGSWNSLKGILCGAGVYLLWHGTCCLLWPKLCFCLQSLLDQPPCEPQGYQPFDPNLQQVWSKNGHFVPLGVKWPQENQPTKQTKKKKATKQMNKLKTKTKNNQTKKPQTQQNKKPPPKPNQIKKNPNPLLYKKLKRWN